MATPAINAILAWLHIFSAIGWMGTAMFFAMVIGPMMPSFSLSTRGELALKLFPRLVRYVAIFATLTLVFGVVLAIGKTGGKVEAFAPDNPWGLNITLGALGAIITYILVLVVVRPSVNKMVKLVEQMRQNPQQDPSAEMASLQKHMRFASTVALTLLLIVLAFMVAAARL